MKRKDVNEDYNEGRNKASMRNTKKKYKKQMITTKVKKEKERGTTATTVTIKYNITCRNGEYYPA